MKNLHLAGTILFILSCLTSACGGKALSAEDQIATGVAATLSAAGTYAALNPLPTLTQTPEPTDIPTPSPIPTDTAIPTETPLPTETPIPTATPGPFVFYEDFTADTGNWEDCELCTWQNNALIMGPFPASNEEMHMNLCSGCGARTTYHMFVDGTFVDGQVDRFFGIVFGVSETTGYYLGISPWQFYIIAEYQVDGDWWEVREMEWSGAVNASYATNNFEIFVQPGSQAGMVDILLYLNSQPVYTFYNRPATESMVGLAINFHDVTVKYDNLIYEEILP